MKPDNERTDYQSKDTEVRKDIDNMTKVIDKTSSGRVKETLQKTGYAVAEVHATLNEDTTVPVSQQVTGAGGPANNP